MGTAVIYANDGAHFPFLFQFGLSIRHCNFTSNVSVVAGIQCAVFIIENASVQNRKRHIVSVDIKENLKLIQLEKTMLKNQFDKIKRADKTVKNVI